MVGSATTLRAILVGVLLSLLPPGAQVAAGSDETFALAVSLSSNRDSPRPLEGAVLHGLVFMFLTPLYPDSAIELVDFYVDDERVKTELHAPYDLLGSFADGQRAEGLDSQRLNDGEHRVEAVIRLRSGERVRLTAAFHVNNRAKAI